jgi:CBS domain-containing protein
MRVGDLLGAKSENVITIDAQADIRTAVRLLMEHGIGALPVLNADGALVGVISERDVVRAVDVNLDYLRTARVDRVMRHPAPTCTPDESLQEVMSRLTRERVRHLVVVEADRPIGVVSVGDLVKHRLEQLETETGVLRDYVAARRAS